MAQISKPVRPHRSATTSTIILLTLLSPCMAQTKTTSPFTDQATGIQFQRFFGARTNFGFGIALPQTPNTSFIGQLTFPLVNRAGWGGFSLTGDMEGPLLMAAWADGAGGVVSSFRQAFDEDNDPPEVTGAFSVRPIAEATSANGSFLTYTFLCEGCLGAALGLDAAAATTAEMGWALGSRAVRNPGSSAGALAFHDTGFGDFEADLAAARSAQFDTWAALAGAPLQPAAGARAFDLAAGDGEGDSGDEGGADEGDRDGEESDDDD
ncbi:CBD9-like protein [Coniochaeta ligniaria NRRL 30616]|uniref:CBD9-like protein n=1 Tax=Coniochaeta ligniaria NRRL 30616 TaxID=1408157 RepID=A0A1J7JX87_9PEZI|nr:CBD9-like protein [Coniochaeta ligniaria NRRL 30616]